MSAVAEPYGNSIFRCLKDPPSDSRSGDGSLRPAISKAAPNTHIFPPVLLVLSFL